MSVVLTRNLPDFRGTAEAEVAARLAAGRSDTFLYVAPTRRRIRGLRREFLERSPSRTAGPMHLFTLETLAAEVCALLGPPKRLLSSQLQAAFVQEAIRSRAADLRYFSLRGSSLRLPRGTLARIANVINRLKQSGVYHSTLAAEIGEGDERERPKLTDIATIYEAYEGLLGERFVDPPGLFKDANLAWVRPGSGEKFRARFPGADLLVIAGFDEFSDPELSLLNYLCETPGLGAVVSFDFHPENGELFGHLQENYRKFLSMGFRPAPAAAGERAGLRAHLARRLFARSGAAGRPGAEAAPFDATGIVTVLDAADRGREVELIAKVIRTEIAGTPGLQPGEVCVCMPRPELYAALFREVFEQAGIPANVTDRFHLEDSMPVTGIVSLLQVAHLDFRIEDILRAATNPFLRLEAGGELLDAAGLYRTSSELRTTSGRKRWQGRIVSRIDFLRGAFGGRGRAGEEIARLERASAWIAALERLVAPFRGSMTPAEFRDATLRLAEEADIAGRIADAAAGASPAGAGEGRGAARGATGADIEREARGFAEFLAFLDDLPEVLSRESGPEERHGLGWYLERFRPLLSQVRYNVRQRYGEGVLVTSIDETRGLSFRLVILAGLVDGEFPSAYEPEIFLTPGRRERRERYHLHEQRHLFYQALSASTGRIFLTRPRREEDVELIPSGFIEELAGAARVTDLTGTAPYASTMVTADGVLARAAAGDGAAAGKADPELLAFVRERVDVERARRRDEGRDPFRGLLDAGALEPAAAARLERLRTAAYSVSDLETYGDCPFRYFAGRMLRLRTTEAPQEGVTPREMGRILHEALFEFYAERRARREPPVRQLDDAAFRSAVAGLLEIAARKFDEIQSDDLFREYNRESVLGAPGRHGILESMLAAERAAEVTAEPSWFEVRFGRAGEDLRHSDPELPAEDPVPAGNILLQGKIDRIDVDAAGGLFRVVDYKTGGKLPAKKDLAEGVSLQLPLYLHCAERILERRAAGATGGPGRAGGAPLRFGAALYYHLRPEFKAATMLGGRDAKGVLIDGRSRERIPAGDGEVAEAVRAAVERADGYAALIAAGRFPVEPRDPAGVCGRCEFRRTCRIRTRVAPAEGEDGEE